jgi:hypothetical protein
LCYLPPTYFSWVKSCLGLDFLFAGFSSGLVVIIPNFFAADKVLQRESFRGRIVVSNQ